MIDLSLNIPGFSAPLTSQDYDESGVLDMFDKMIPKEHEAMGGDDNYKFSPSVDRGGGIKSFRVERP